MVTGRAQNSLGDGGNDIRVEQHSRFNCPNPNIGRHRLNLCHHSFRSQSLDASHPQSVLSRHTGHSARSVNAVKGKRSQIRLNSSTPTTIRSGDGEGNRYAIHTSTTNRAIAAFGESLEYPIPLPISVCYWAAELTV